MGIPQNAFPVLGGLGALLALGYVVTQLLKKHTYTNLLDKVVVITGASSGLGEALAHAFYRSGAKVILCARRQNELIRVKQDLLATVWPFQKTHQPHVVVLDLTDFTNMNRVVDDIVKIHGTIDVLVNNGGMSYRGDIMSTDLEVDKRLMDVNYFGQVALTKAVLPVMKMKQSGHIVAVSSLQGKISIPFRSAYSASKHALDAFFDCLRAEVADYGIHVSVVRPGYIQTSLSLNAVTGSGTKYGVMDKTTESGMKPEDVAKEIVHSVQYYNKDVTIAKIVHKLAIYVRTIAPSAYFYIMTKRARAQRKDVEKNK